MTRPLDPEERALWERVIATVRPLHPRAEAAPEPPADPVQAAPKPAKSPPPSSVKSAPPPPRPRPAHADATLDGSWDRRLSRGLIQPDRFVDLHGHHLASAYDLLHDRLEEGIAAGARVILLVTGKPPRDEARPVVRGAIRAAVGEWLAASRHAGAIAAVRGAHPRHGGEGALYIILRRAAR